MDKLRLYILIAVVAAILLAIYLINSQGVVNLDSKKVVTVSPRISLGEKSKKYDLAKEITSPDGFINTDGNPVTIGELVGKKVVLVDFWTYSCINCQRTTPYLNSWYEKYKDKGFIIIGIHTPEFEFEKSYSNVQKAAEKLGIKYPVVLDNDYSTWTAYRNRYWPRKYLIDIDGYIVYDHIGEGGYEETERNIQEALEERMAVVKEFGTIQAGLTKETPVQEGNLNPEIYFGASRNEFFANGAKGVVGTQHNLTLPEKVDSNTLYLSGSWNISSEFAQNTSSNSKILYQFTARDVFFVAESNSEVVVEILLDSYPLSLNLGEDVTETSDGRTIVKVRQAGLYKLIQGENLGTHTLELIIQKPGLKAFTFTFG